MNAAPVAMGTPSLVTLVTLVASTELAAFAFVAVGAVVLAVKRGWIKASFSFAVIPPEKRAPRPVQPAEPTGAAADDDAPATPVVPPRTLRGAA